MVTTKGNLLEIDNPSKLPSAQEIDEIHEPMVQATIITPDTYVGPIMQLCQDKRGMFKNMEYLNPTRAMLTYEIPLSEILMDFFDRLKSCSQGYASLDYEITKYQQADLVKLDILINGKPVDALSTIIHREKAAHYGRSLAKSSKKSFHSTCSKCRFRLLLVQKSLPEKLCGRSGKTSLPSAMAATFPASASSLKSKKKVKNA